jgi:hypothetical protein
MVGRFVAPDGGHTRGRPRPPKFAEIRCSQTWGGAMGAQNPVPGARCRSAGLDAHTELNKQPADRPTTDAYTARSCGQPGSLTRARRLRPTAMPVRRPVRGRRARGDSCRWSPAGPTAAPLPRRAVGRNRGRQANRAGVPGARSSVSVTATSASRRLRRSSSLSVIGGDPFRMASAPNASNTPG